MSEVVGARAENDLRIARHLDLPGTIAPVGDREPSHFDVIFRRNGDYELHLDVLVAPAEDRFLGEKGDHEIVQLGADRLVSGGPDGTRSNIAEVEKLAPGVAGTVFPPTGHCHSPKEAGATPRVGERPPGPALGQKKGG